jgi:hypothetical protein
MASSVVGVAAGRQVSGRKSRRSSRKCGGRNGRTDGWLVACPPNRRGCARFHGRRDACRPKTVPTRVRRGGGRCPAVAVIERLHSTAAAGRPADGRTETAAGVPPHREVLRARVTDRDRPARDGESRFTLGIILPRSSSLAPPLLRPPRRTGNSSFFLRWRPQTCWKVNRRLIKMKLSYRLWGWALKWLRFRYRKY